MLLLYANLPFVLPATDAVRPAKIVAVLCLAAMLGEILCGQRTFSFCLPEGGVLIVFLVAAAASCVTALWPNYAVEAVVDLVKMVIVFFFLENCANTERRLQGVMWTMIVGGMFPALGTLKNYLSGNLEDGRAAWLGIFANPNEVAYSLVILLPLAAYLAATRGWIIRCVLAGVTLVYLASTFLTFSRGGLIGLAAVLAVYSWRKRNIWLRTVMICCLLGGLLFVGRYWSRGENFSQLSSDATFRMRVATSMAGLNMFLDHPFVGVGLNCSVIAWPLYAPPGLYTRGALITHNTFIQVMGETGLLGSLAFVSLVGTGLFHARRLALDPASSNLGIAIETSLWGFVICGLSGGYVLTWWPYILLGLAASARRIVEERK